MKLLFHKTEYYGHWFQDDENPENFTEKIPPDTRYIFDEEVNEWVPLPEPEPTEEHEQPTEEADTE
jgi:hypothetical protein